MACPVGRRAPIGPDEPGEALRSLARKEYDRLPDANDRLVSSLQAKPRFRDFESNFLDELENELADKPVKPFGLHL